MSRIIAYALVIVLARYPKLASFQARFKQNYFNQIFFKLTGLHVRWFLATIIIYNKPKLVKEKI